MVNRGERNESAQKNEDEVGRDAAYMRPARIHAHGGKNRKDGSNSLTVSQMRLAVQCANYAQRV